MRRRAGQRLHRRAVPGAARRARQGGLRITGVPDLRPGRPSWPGGCGIPVVDLDDVPAHRPDRGRRRRDRAAQPRPHQGRGGALLREKLVAAAADRLCIIADGSKLVARLGEQLAVPVAVVPFGWRQTAERIRRLGTRAVLAPGRRRPAGHRRRPLHPRLRASARSPIRPRSTPRSRARSAWSSTGSSSGWPGGRSWPAPDGVSCMPGGRAGWRLTGRDQPRGAGRRDRPRRDQDPLGRDAMRHGAILGEDVRPTEAEGGRDVVAGSAGGIGAGGRRRERRSDHRDRRGRRDRARHRRLRRGHPATSRRTCPAGTRVPLAPLLGERLDLPGLPGERRQRRRLRRVALRRGRRAASP